MKNPNRLTIFKLFTIEVENQFNKGIKIVRPNCCGKYYGRYDDSDEQCLRQI